MRIIIPGNWETCKFPHAFGAPELVCCFQLPPHQRAGHTEQRVEIRRASQLCAQELSEPVQRQDVLPRLHDRNSTQWIRFFRT